MTPGRRLMPVPTPDSEEFWRGCHEGVLRMQRCRACGTWNWFPRGLCVNCSSGQLEWITLSGTGTVYSFSLVARPPSGAFPASYLLALVELAEGPRMMTHLINVDPAEVRTGMQVAVEFERHADDIALPVFAPAR
jgi:uncharacterized protein